MIVYLKLIHNKLFILFSPSFEEQHERVFRLQIFFIYLLTFILIFLVHVLADHGVHSRNYLNMSEYKLEANLSINLGSLYGIRKESASSQINKCSLLYLKQASYHASNLNYLHIHYIYIYYTINLINTLFFIYSKIH